MLSTHMPHYPGKDLEAMSFAVNYHRWILDEFEPYLGETVAEVGAGVGTVSQLLLDKHIKRLVAFEPSRNMYPLLAEKLRQEERAQTVNDFFTPEYMPEGFDTVAYINVLEHIQDYCTELSHARKALKPQGYILIFVPALPWLYSDFDRYVGHFRRYTHQELQNSVRDAGFTIVKTCYFDLAGMIFWYINFVLLRKSMHSGSVSLYDKLLVPTMRRLERIIPPPIGKNLLLVGQKI